MGWWSQDYICRECDLRFNLVIQKDDRELKQPCPECELPAAPTFSVPKNLRASYHDGVKRPGFREGALSSELEGEAYNHAPGSEERTRLLSESKKLKEVKK